MNRAEATSRCWAEIDLNEICGNYLRARELTGGAEVICVLKGNAYGLGAVEVGRALMAAYACIGKECPGYVTSPSFKVTRENLLEGYRTSLGIEASADVQAALNG